MSLSPPMPARCCRARCCSSATCSMPIPAEPKSASRSTIPAGACGRACLQRSIFQADAESRDAVPTSALVLKDDVTQVFVETAPWTFQPRTVDIAFQQGDQAFLRERHQGRRAHRRQGRSAAR